MANVTKISVNEQEYAIRGTLYDELGNNTDGPLTQLAISNIINDMKSEMISWKSVSAGTIINGIVTTNLSNVSYPNGRWLTTNAKYKGYFKAVNPGDVYKVTSNNTSSASVYILETNSIVDNEEPDYIDGYDRLTSLYRPQAGKSIFFTIPEGAGYLWVQTLNNNVDCKPNLYIAQKSVQEESAENASELTRLSGLLNNNTDDIDQVKSVLKEVPLKSVTVFEPTYCDGYIASKKNGSSGNQKKICNLSAIYAKKGDAVTIIPNTELLSEGEYFTYGLWESNRTSYLPATTNLTTSNGLLEAHQGVTNTDTNASFTINNSATTMVHICIAKWSSDKVEQVLQPASGYEAGGLFKVQVTNYDALDYRIPILENDRDEQHEQIVGMLEMLAKKGTTFASVGMGNYVSFSNYGPIGYDSTAKTFKIEAKSDSKYGIIVCPVTKGQVIRRTVSSTVNRTIYYGFTQTEITAENIENIVDTEEQDGIIFDHAIRATGKSFDNIITVPYDGWMVYYRYNQNWNSDQKLWNLVSYPDINKLNELLDTLEEKPLEGTTIYEPTYCPGNIASKWNGTAGNKSFMCNLSGIYAKKGNIVTIKPNEEFLDEGQYYIIGYTETDHTTPVSATTNIATYLKRYDIESSATNRKFTFEVTSENCSMVYFVIGKRNSAGTNVSLQRKTVDGVTTEITYEPGELFTVEVTNTNAIDYRLDTLENIVGSNDNNVISLHNKKETLFKLNNLRRVGFSTTLLTPGNLNFIHFSDIHQGEANNYNNLSRIMEYFNEYSDYIDFVLNTGDFVPDAFADYQTKDGSSRLQSSAIAISANKGYDMNYVINVIGNHDTALKYSPNVAETYDWVAYCGLGPQYGEYGFIPDSSNPNIARDGYANAYDRYIKPFVEGWESLAKPSGSPETTLIQPENAESEGKCYYYKDFYRGTYNSVAYYVRLIVIDVMDLTKIGANNISQCEQMNWLRTVLNASMNIDNKNYSVIVASHYGFISDGERVRCPFSTILDEELANTGFMSIVMEVIGDFVANGGKFACLLAGHVHKDVFGYYKHIVTNNNETVVYRLPVIRIDTACVVGQSGSKLMPHRVDDKSYDLFNVFSIDPLKKKWCIFRVGADFDSMLHHIGTMSHSYANLSNENNLLAYW